MAEEPEKPGGEAKGAGSEDSVAKASPGDEAENERPTVSPPFDPIAFARDILRPSEPSIPAVPGPPLTPNTLATPPQGVEQQAASIAASRRSGTLDAPEDASAPPRRKTPTSTLSLANARIPSNLPPRQQDLEMSPDSKAVFEPKRTESLSSMNAVDREWADMEIATRPPPADGPDEDPVIEIASTRVPTKLDLDDVEIEFDDERGVETVRRPVPVEIDDEGRPPLSGQPAGSIASAAPAPTPKSTAETREQEMSDRVSLGDYSGALEIAEKILSESPRDSAALACAENCRTVLRQMYATRIGPLDRVPVVMIPRDQLRWLSIDHKAGFVLSLVDGVSTLEMIIDVSGMAELDTLRILSELTQQRIISLR